MAKPRHIKDLLHKDNCEYLTAWLHQCVKNKEAINDTQCPKSWAMGHHPVTDKLLEEMTSRMEEETGKRLFPTYAYARLYQKGDFLGVHTDRPACEYSLTVTLGSSGEVSPLHFGEQGTELDQGVMHEDGDKVVRVKDIQAITMDIGDAVLYQGCETLHWREEFKNEWQTQVFLHWVDQDGPYAEWKYDKRPCLAHHDQPEQPVQNRPEEILYWYVPNAIADISCDQMMQKFESAESHKAFIGGDEGKVDLSVRDVNKIPMTHEVGIGATLTGMGFNMNKRAWNFDVTHSNQSEYLKYDADGHYKTHVDTFCCPGDTETRKITILAFLNDDFEGGRLYLENGHERIYPPQEKGTVLAFPSFINHGVEPVTKGIRRSIVTWLVGPWFR